MAAGFVFHRPELARRMADIALGTDPLAGNSGLFLAAPRRTGKSTLLKADLVPELESRGALPVYVDLWADRSRDPGEVIAEKIRATIQDHESGILKVARKSGMSKIGIGSWLAVDIEKIGRPGGATMADAIAYLNKRAGRPIVLIVDEAQHALTSQTSVTAMFSLKSARDALNIGVDSSDVGNVRLGLVFTGSHRDKLASLVIGKNQPFFGASVTDFPLLGADFAAAYADFVNTRLAGDRQIDKKVVARAFEIVAFRPELLQAAVREYVTGSIGVNGSSPSLLEQAYVVRERYWQEFDSQWTSMTPLQRAVLRRIIDQGENYRPFDADSLAAYSENANQQVTVPDAQSALDALREKGLVIRMERGRYALDDTSLIDWLADRTTYSTPRPS
ncbi:hypothetical protein [Bradyrhizobium guangdongense]|uniref:Uncharacterized protein n=2 Tax=Bradyrhizobium guangdongense TaxID=1325090 RepID=A0A410V9B8_9BRAD|nr:hypothetical protein [Bradyrhizobium guangdongense]QAU40244.1 hypothetical protein X265_23140 [Bradyrhizobium guangdongense]GGI28264.1 hypothetical protein GCM10010987_48520 [Bradyrhizobium guangdongense]